MACRELTVFILLTIWTLTNGQFLYNYEQDQSFDVPSSEEYDTSSYKYNSPSALEHFRQSQRQDPIIREPAPVYRSSRSEHEPETGNYQSSPQSNQRNIQAIPEPIIDDYELEPEYVPEPPRPQRRRTTRRRKTRVRQTAPEVVQPPRYYGPSIFENIGLGQAPNGVHVPHDSLLNLLKEDNQRNTQARHAGVTNQAPTRSNAVVARQVQSENAEHYNPSPFFVEPRPPSPSQAYSSNAQSTIPHRENYEIEPFSREAPIQNEVQSPQPVYRQSSQEIQQDVYRQQRRVNRGRSLPHAQPQAMEPPRRRQQRPAIQHAPAARVEEEVPPPQVVHTTRANQVFEDDVQRIPTRRHQETRARNERPQPSRYYGPSIFENIGLGEAPTGVYIPQDSLLNVLKENNQWDTQSTHEVLTNYAPTQSNTNVAKQVQQSRSERYNYSPFFVEQPPPPVPQAYLSSERSTIRHRDNQEIDQFLPEAPEKHQVRSQQPVYRPSSQEIQQDVYRQQRRANRGRTVQPPAAQPPKRRAQRPIYQQVPAARVEEEVPPPPAVHVTESNQVFDDDVQRIHSRRRQETHNRKRRPQVNAITPAPRERHATTFKPAQLAIAELPDDTDDDGIPGGAGQDYPTLHVIPKTSFSCAQQPHDGYYADLETSCQVVHLCHSRGVQSSFLCPNGTIFSQEKFSCQWWYKVDCQNSPRYYSINDSLYKVPGEKKK